MRNLLEWIQDNLLEITVVGVCVLLLIACAWAAVYESDQWAVYAKEHHCVAKGTKKGQFVMGSDGKTGYTQDQTVFVCDGGEIVIR